MGRGSEWARQHSPGGAPSPARPVHGHPRHPPDTPPARTGTHAARATHQLPIRASLGRMGVAQAAIGQLHWSTAGYAPPQERALWDGLARMHDAGLVRAVGVSNYGPRQLARIGAYLDKRGVPLATVQARRGRGGALAGRGVRAVVGGERRLPHPHPTPRPNSISLYIYIPLSLSQVQYSLLSCGPEVRASVAAAADVGATVLAYSPLALGALGGKYSAGGPLPPGPRGLLFRRLLPEAEAAGLTAAVAGVAAATGRTPAQVALAWCAAKGAVPLAGARDAAQVASHVGALAAGKLSAADVAALDAAAGRVPRGMPQNVFQTR